MLVIVRLQTSHILKGSACSEGEVQHSVQGGDIRQRRLCIGVHIVGKWTYYAPCGTGADPQQNRKPFAQSTGIQYITSPLTPQYSHANHSSLKLLQLKFIWPCVFVYIIHASATKRIYNYHRTRFFVCPSVYPYHHQHWKNSDEICYVAGQLKIKIGRKCNSSSYQSNTNL